MCDKSTQPGDSVSFLANGLPELPVAGEAEEALWLVESPVGCLLRNRVRLPSPKLNKAVQLKARLAQTDKRPGGMPHSSILRAPISLFDVLQIGIRFPQLAKQPHPQGISLPANRAF